MDDDGLLERARRGDEVAFSQLFGRYQRAIYRALASFGLASIDAGSSANVLADVLVGDDGLARAVRFVRPTVQ